MRGILLATLLIFGFVNFSEGALIVNPPKPITDVVTINPIVVGNGVTFATWFGTDTQRLEIEGFVDTIMSQVGIDVEWMSPSFYNQSFLYDQATSLNQFAAITPDSIESTIPSVVNMWFVRKVPNAAAPGTNSANGLAFIDDEGVALAIGSNLPTFTGGREAIAGLTAHELSHNLGLEHPIPTIPNNLMEASIVGHLLEQSQMDTIYTDTPSIFDGFDLLVPLIPEPSPGIFLGFALVGFAVRRKR